MASCLLACGIDPEKSILFQQSQVCYVCFNLIETVDLMETGCTCCVESFLIFSVHVLNFRLLSLVNIGICFVQV